MAIRLLVAGGALCLASRSVWMARADWLASGDLPDLARAIKMEPRDGSLLALDAIYRNDNGDLSPAIDQELLRAGELNPLDSRVPMTLGLRAEFRGDLQHAEAYLLRAVQLDAQFKPSWTLANFYVRRNQPEKAWPLLRHCLELEPLGYSPDPIFDLCWDTEADARRILALVPKRNPRLIQYLSYLVRTNKVAAAAEVWPEALAIADPTSDEELGLLRPLPGFLARGGHASAALHMWNRLVDRGMVHAAALNPSKGLTLADPQFQFGLTEDPFGWVISEPEGVFGSNVESTLRFELNGNEPEAFEMLHTTAAVTEGQNYKLNWEADGSQLSMPQDPGFRFNIRQSDLPQAAVVECPPLLASGNAGACQFTAPESTDSQGSTLMRVTLSYSRAPGTTRPQGVLRLRKISVEPVR